MSFPALFADDLNTLSPQPKERFQILNMSEQEKDHATYIEDASASSENVIVEEQEEKMTIQAYLAIAASPPPKPLY